MPTASRAKLFPASQRDVSRLRQSATDAVNDFSSTATTHANKVGSELHELAGHLRDESGRHFARARGRVVDLAVAARDFASDRPLVCIGAALAIGFLIGWSRRRRPAPRE